MSVVFNFQEVKRNITGRILMSMISIGVYIKTISRHTQSIFADQQILKKTLYRSNIRQW